MGSVNFIQSKSEESAEVMQICRKHNKHDIELKKNIYWKGIQRAQTSIKDNSQLLHDI